MDSSAKDIMIMRGGQLRQEDEGTAAAMIRRPVRHLVHDSRAQHLHMFVTEADNALIAFLASSPALLASANAQEPDENLTLAERQRVRKLTHHLHVVGGRVSKTSLRR